MFIDFTNFYQRFIQSFYRINALFTLLLKITRLLNLVLKIFKDNDNKIVGVDDEPYEMVINLSKNLTYIPNIGAIKKPPFLTPNTKKVFNYLLLIFIKTLILQYFDLQSYI